MRAPFLGGSDCRAGADASGGSRNRRRLSPAVVCLASFDITAVVLGAVVPVRPWFWVAVLIPNALLFTLHRRAAYKREVAHPREDVRDDLDRQAAPLAAGRNGHHFPTNKSAPRR